MKDEVLNTFIEKMVSEDINSQEFKMHIENFSRFLSYTNSDYKYNGTYLVQYIDDFIETIMMLKKKNEKYINIIGNLVTLGYNFEVLFDQVYFVRFLSKKQLEQEYIGLKKDKIMSKKIEFRMTLFWEEKEYVFSKEYKDFQDDRLIDNIRKDIKSYIKLKKIRRS